MILSESEKNRIRGLHREASVVKTKIVIQEQLFGLPILKKIAELVPAELKDKIEKATEKDTYVNPMVKWLRGKSGILPGDQTELKKNINKGAKEVIDYLTGVKTEDNKAVNEQVEGGSDPVAYLITKLTDKIKDLGEFITGGTDVSKLKDVIKKAVDEVMDKEEEVLKGKMEESKLK